MKAWRYQAFGAPPELVELPAPACPDDGVVLEVGATGVCRSDWHAWTGHDPVVLPQVPGHEFAGTIVEVGERVSGWQVGQRVTAPFVLGCGTCQDCTAGDAQVCPHQEQPGFTLPGSFAEQVAVPRADFNLIALPEQVGFVAAASLGCRFATAFRALTAHGRVQPGQWVAVHGCGGVGLSAVMVAAALGARVIAVDVSPAALDWARSLGAEHVVSGSGDAAATIMKLTDGGAQVSIDAAGTPLTAAASVRSLRRRGRHIQIGLLLGAAAAAPLPLDRVIGWELEIYGSHGMAAHEYPAMLALVADGTLDPGRLVGRVIDLEEAGAALMGMDAPAGPGMTIVGR